MSTRYLSRFALPVAVLTTLATVQAQNDPPTRPQPTTPTTPTTRGMQDQQNGNEADRILASWLLIDNHKEIELAKLAQQRSQNPQVKQFAQQMIQEHGQFGSKLRQYGDPRVTSMMGETGAGGLDTTGRTGRTEGTGQHPSGQNPTGRTEPTGQDPTGRNEPNPTGRTEPTGRPADATGQRGGMGSSDFNHIELAKELGEKCLASARQELQSKSGAEFDRCYMGMQVGAHMAVLDKLQVFGRHASSSLKQVLTQGEQTVQSHLTHAKQIVQQLEQDGGLGKADGSSGGLKK